MASPRIFIPNAQSETPNAALARVGLGGLLFADDWPIGHTKNADGPEKMRGLLISWETTIQRPGVQAPRFEFSAEKDIALRAPAEPALSLPEGRFHLILEPGRPVVPADLKRKPPDQRLRGAIALGHDSPEVMREKTAKLSAMTYHEGIDVVMGDGNAWTLPNMTQLPCTVAYQAAESRWGVSVAGAFRPLYDRMLTIFEACQRHLFHDFVNRHTPEQLEFVADELTESLTAEPLDDCGTAWPFICDMLALNYRLTPWIIDQLGLLKLELLWECLCAITNARALRTLYQVLEKKSDQLTACGSITSSGDDSSPDGSPPSPTSGS